MTRTQTAPLTLGTRLVALRDIAVCDTPTGPQHEVVCVTDGQHAYVYPLDDRTQVEGDTIVCRMGVTLEATCPATGCIGRVSWRLDADHGWGADGDALRLLTAYGQQVEQ